MNKIMDLSIRKVISGIVAVFMLAACAPQAAPGTPTANQSPTKALPSPTIVMGQSQSAPTVSSPIAPAPAATSTATTAPTLPVLPQVSWKLLAGGLERPVDLQELPDGTERLVILEQAGVIRVMTKAGGLQSVPFLDLRDRVGSKSTEQGLLGIAVHPKFAENGFFFVNYTDLAGNTVISRFTSQSGANQVDSKSEKIFIQVKQPYPNHNGGGLAFGPDGYLYIGLGDGGSGGDPQNRAQSLNTLLGKLLRIDVNGGNPYTVPADNPYARSGGLPEIWAYGLRNPWRFSFDRLTGDLYIADVGQNQWEEVDFVAAGTKGGVNFGWRIREGAHPNNDTPPVGVALVDPVWEYSHQVGCSITGGFVYRGQVILELVGSYLYGDYCSGMLWGLRKDSSGHWQNQALPQIKAAISSFGQDLKGEIYLLDHNGSVFALARH